MQKHRLRYFVLSAVLSALAAGSTATVMTAAARATTGDGAALPDPTAEVPYKVGDEFAGRFFASRVARKAHVLAAQLDIAWEEEAAFPFFFGEIELRMYQGGKVTVVKENLYPFEYNAATHRLWAGLVPTVSVTAQHPDGVPIGRLAFVVRNVIKEEIDPAAELSLNGHGPFKITFKRGNDDAPAPSPLPRAKRIGK